MLSKIVISVLLLGFLVLSGCASHHNEDYHAGYDANHSHQHDEKKHQNVNENGADGTHVNQSAQPLTHSHHNDDDEGMGSGVATGLLLGFLFLLGLM